MRLLPISLVAIALLTAATPTAPAQPDVERAKYHGSTPLSFTDPYTECGRDGKGGIGVVCYTLPSTAHTLDFNVRDETRRPVGGTYYVYDAAGAFHSQGVHCNGAEIAVPPGGTAIIRLETLNGPLICLAAGETTAIAGTFGTIRLAAR